MSLLKKLWPKNSLATTYDREVESNKRRRAKNWPKARVTVRVYNSLTQGTRIVNATMREGNLPLRYRLSRREWRLLTRSERRYQKDQRQTKLARERAR